MSVFGNKLLEGLGGGIASALTGGLASVVGSGIGALFGNSSTDDNKELMQLQAQYSKELMDYQHQLNSPREYVSQLKDAGLSTALMFSKGANQVATSLGSSPQGDLAGLVQSKAIMSQLGMQAAQTQLLKSEAKKNDAETENIKQQTRGIMTDNEFKERLNQGNLDYLDAQTQELLRRADLNVAETAQANAMYDKLVKDLDVMDSQIAEYSANAAKMNSEAALFDLEKTLRREITDSEISKNEAAIREMAATAYAAVKQGDAAAVDEANGKLQGIILAARSKNAPRLAAAELVEAGYKAQSAMYSSRFEKQRAKVEETKASYDKLMYERKKGSNWLYDYTPFGTLDEIYRSVGQVFGAGASVVTKPTQ